jgi:hypothetical protein
VIGHSFWMPLISACIEPGCSKLCMGLFCIDHDSGPCADLPRGRPWPPARRGVAQTVAPEPVAPLAVAPVAVGDPVAPAI